MKKDVLKLARIEPRKSVVIFFTVPTELSRFPINDEYSIQTYVTEKIKIL